jgi:hypothetical protein
MLTSAATEVNEPWVVSRLSSRVRFQVSPPPPEVSPTAPASNQNRKKPNKML